MKFVQFQLNQHPDHRNSDVPVGDDVTDRRLICCDRQNSHEPCGTQRGHTGDDRLELRKEDLIEFVQLTGIADRNHQIRRTIGAGRT